MSKYGFGTNVKLENWEVCGWINSQWNFNIKPHISILYENILILCPNRKWLFTGTVHANKNYVIGTVPANKNYDTGTVGGGGSIKAFQFGQ